MITIYQNRWTYFASEEQKEAKYAMMLGADKWQPEFVKFYTPQFEVDTDNLEIAFDVANMGNGYLGVTLRKMDNGYSASVGDIFVSPEGTFIVDSFGFKQIEDLMETKISITYAMAE